MAVSLLATKLYIPSLRPNSVSRPRLVERLNKGLRLGHRLILLSASAGSGKTTLLGEWVNSLSDWVPDSVSASAQRVESHIHVAWISLDEGDNDPARFLSYLVAALQTVRADIGAGVLDLFQAAQPSSLDLALTGLINEITSISEPLILVLDDYHVVEAESVHSAITFLLDHLPPRNCLAIGTRSDPPLPVARMRGRGQLTELRQADLRFTVDETAHFLDQALGVPLSTPDVAALTARTEGWIAGLQMAALSLQRREDVGDFVRSFTGSHRYILDYLVEEVLWGQPDAIRDFMLRTAVLDRLSGPLCDAVAGEIKEAQTVLEYLESANLFVVPLDDERRWYRYHHLFADLLRQRLRRAHPDLVPVLHRRASGWYEQNGLMFEAIDHALLAEEFERAAGLIDECAESAWGGGAHNTLSGWLEALPDEQVILWPRLCAVHAMVLFAGGQLGRADLRLQTAERVLDSREDGTAAEQRGMVAAVRAFIAYFEGDGPDVIRFADQALKLLPEESVMWRSSAAANLGDAYRWRGDMAAAGRAYEQALAAAQATGNSFLILVAGVKQALNQVVRGQLHQAVETCQQQLRRLDEGGLSETPMAGGVLTVWGSVLYERNDLDRAMQVVRKACDLSERGSSVGILGLSYLTLLRILWARRETTGVEETIQRLETLVRESNVPVWIASGVAVWKAQVLISQGNLRAASQLLRERGVSVDSDLSYPRQGEHLALVRLLMAQDRLREAERLLGRLLQAAETTEQTGWVIGIQVLRSLILRAQGDDDRAMTALERALFLAEPEGYVRVFVDEGEPMAALLRRAEFQGISRDYVHRLLSAFGVQEPGSAEVPVQQRHASTLIESLSEREMEVLRLLTGRLSSAGIAEALFISVNTVRTHIRSIYGKLGVHSRYEAVAWARELGLL